MHKMSRMFGRTAFVVKEVQIDETKECQIKVVARKAGLVGWAMSVLGIDSTYTLSVYSNRIESKEGSLVGFIKTVVPLSSIDTCTSGFTKPFQSLVTAGILVVLALLYSVRGYPGGIVFFVLILATVSFAWYFLRRCLVLNFTTKGGNGICFLFKRSVIEGINVDEALADRIADIVKQNYLAVSYR